MSATASRQSPSVRLSADLIEAFAGTFLQQAKEKLAIHGLLRRIDIRGENDCWPWIEGTDKNGYGLFRWSGDGVTHRANRFIFEVFNPDVKAPEVTHSCNNPPCCNPRHLIAGTHTDNMQYMVSCGRSHKPTGELNGRTNLTDDVVRAIRKDTRSQGVIAVSYGISRPTVSHIKRGATWTHVV